MLITFSLIQLKWFVSTVNQHYLQKNILIVQIK